MEQAVAVVVSERGEASGSSSRRSGIQRQQKEAAVIAAADGGGGEVVVAGDGGGSRRRWRWRRQQHPFSYVAAAKQQQQRQQRQPGSRKEAVFAALQRSVIIRTQTQTQSTHVLEWAVGSDWSGPGPRRAPDPHRFHSLAGHLIADNKLKAKRSWN
jgi:hypothetical protein